MKLENNEANVDILAKFPFGSFPVERITITCDDNVWIVLVKLIISINPLWSNLNLIDCDLCD